MKIIGLTFRDSGCGFHRILTALGFMDDITGYVTNLLTDEVQGGCDILLYNRITPYDGSWPDVRAELGCKIVIDLDDYWKLPPSHINSGHYESFGPRIENNIKAADMVTVTNEYLARKVRPFHDNVVIVPNGIPFGLHQFNEYRSPSDRIRIFWAGGITHDRDIELLRNPIKRLAQYRDKIEMVIGGYNDYNEVSRSIWDRMVSAFTAGGSIPSRKLEGMATTTYMKLYENADIMVIPLEATEWHACKSNLKMLEAASKRIPVIVSDVAPYNLDADAPVLWVRSQKDWFRHLQYLILNPQAREDMGNKLYEWAKEKYDIKKINAGRRKAFADLLQAPPLLRHVHESGVGGELSSPHPGRASAGLPGAA